MVLSEFARNNPTGDFSILASDISTRVLEIAQKGIYPESTVATVRQPFKNNYIMKGKKSKTGYCRIVPELRNRVQFKRINLNEGSQFGIKIRMDIIFCRNVIIYFDRDTQKKLFDKFFKQLLPGGHLFIGHSETLHGINDRFKPGKVAIYKKPLE
jgi:chemotaxis protein methyltransferase CheR